MGCLVSSIRTDFGFPTQTPPRTLPPTSRRPTGNPPRIPQEFLAPPSFPTANPVTATANREWGFTGRARHATVVSVAPCPPVPWCGLRRGLSWSRGVSREQENASVVLRCSENTSQRRTLALTLQFSVVSIISTCHARPLPHAAEPLASSWGLPVAFPPRFLSFGVHPSLPQSPPPSSLLPPLTATRLALPLPLPLATPQVRSRQGVEPVWRHPAPPAVPG